MKILYQEADLDAVMRFFSDGFEPKPGKRFTVREWIIDTHKRTVVFKIFIDDIDEEAHD